MDQYKNYTTISLIFIGLYFLAGLFGEYIIMEVAPIFNSLYERPSLYTISISLKYSSINILVPAIYFFVTLILSRKLGLKPYFWSMLAFHKGISAIILLFIWGYNNYHRLSIPKIVKSFSWLILCLLVITVMKYSLSYFIEFPYEDFIEKTRSAEQSLLLISQTINNFVLNIIIPIGVNVLIALWLYREVKERNEKSLMWFLLALAGGLLAPILYFIKSLFLRKTTD